MSAYKVGSLANLFSKGDDGAVVDDVGKELFRPNKRQRERPKEETRVQKKKKSREEKEARPWNGASNEGGAGRDVGGERKKKKKVKNQKERKKGGRGRDIEGKREGDDGDDDGEDEDQKRSSLMVRYEDGKSRVEDAAVDARTVFVGNLKWNVKVKKIRRIFSEFGTVESVRLRCAARPDTRTSKKVAVIKRTFHEGRTNICAYVKFADADEAKKSCALNGTELDGNVIRVDLADRKPGSSEEDLRRSVFVGNLDFALEENALRAHFSRSALGAITSVRVVRDRSTGVGKGFGYVAFAEESAAAKAAGEMNGSELAGRPIRVQRCVKKPKKSKPTTSALPPRKPLPPQRWSKGSKKAKAGQKKAPVFEGKTFDDGSKKNKAKKNWKQSKTEKKKAAIAKKLSN